MPDAADDALDPVVSTGGDVKRDETGIPGQSDIPPKPKDRTTRSQESRVRSKEAQTKSSELKSIRAGLEGILEAPALVIQEPWPKAHVAQAGPNLAAAIIKKAENDADFRKKLNAFLAAGDGAGLIFAAFMYAAPLAIYYGVPAPPPVKKALQIPPRPAKLPDIPLPDLPEDGIVREAAEAGFDDVEEYKRAVARAAAASHPGAVMPDG